MRFSLIKQLPKTPLLALAAVALALVAAGGGAKSAHGQTATSYTIELSFDTISWSAIFDWEFACWSTCDHAEVYGTINGRTTNTGVAENGARNLATWGNSADCENGWAGSEGRCLRGVAAGSTYRFADAPMCASYTHTLCTAGYAKSNNKIRLTVMPGEQIRARVLLYDYDELNSDDVVCSAARWVGPFTAAELATLNKSNLGMGMAFNDHGSCTVSFSLKRVS